MKKTLGLLLLGLGGLPSPGAADDLWDGFREPPAEARPFVRCCSLEDNPMARAWSHQREGPEAVGMLGPVRLHAVQENGAASRDEGSSR